MNEKEIKELIAKGRDFMKCQDEDPEYKSDQELKLPQPPLCKAPVSDERIALSTDFSDLAINNDLLSVINSRTSHRVYTMKNLTLKQLSYLLWCCQGIKEIRGKSYATLRTVPCGGARHEYEMYMAVNLVEGLKKGYYHYLPMTHELEFLGENCNMEEFIGSSVKGQNWAGKASVVFYPAMVSYRAEWRYGIYAHRVALTDLGYISSNLYTASTSIGLGGCAIGAVDVGLTDQAFGLDGDEEFVAMAHAIGTISEDDKQQESDFYAFVKEQGL